MNFNISSQNSVIFPQQTQMYRYVWVTIAKQIKPKTKFVLVLKRSVHAVAMVAHLQP